MSAWYLEAQLQKFRHGVRGSHVEDEAGLGYIVRVGTPIGPNDGTVRDIERGRVLIQEDSIDYYGEHHPTEVVMDLRTAERGKQ